MEIKMKLRELRKLNHYTQLHMAEKLDIPLSTYRNYEAGLAEPNIEILKKLSLIFDVTLDELVGITSDQQLFSDARVPKPYYQRLYEALSLVDRGRAEGYMERLIEEEGGNVIQIKTSLI